MINGKKVLGIIPARGGSKGLPDKNIKELAGEPLIAWTIEEVNRCNAIDRTIISTDSEKIADVAKRYGGDVPFIRPKKLATDTAKGIDVIFHAISLYEKEFDIIAVFQPTSPLRKLKNIKEAFKLLADKNAKAIVSVCKSDCPPLWVNTLPEDGNMKDFINPRTKNKNRQEIDSYYRLNGAIYISYIPYFKKNKGFYGDRTYAYIMPKVNSVDIDDIIDFKFVEFLMKESLNE